MTRGETLLILTGMGIALVHYIAAKLLTSMANRHFEEVGDWHRMHDAAKEDQIDHD